MVSLVNTEGTSKSLALVLGPVYGSVQPTLAFTMPHSSRPMPHAPCPIPHPLPPFFSPPSSPLSQLHHSVPLSVGRGWQCGPGLEGELRQVLLVLGHRGPDSAVLPVEEARAAVLQVLGVVQGCLGGKTVLPVLRIVEGLFGLLVGHDGAGVRRVEGVSRVQRVPGVGVGMGVGVGWVQGVAGQGAERRWRRVRRLRGQVRANAVLRLCAMWWRVASLGWVLGVSSSSGSGSGGGPCTTRDQVR